MLRSHINLFARLGLIFSITMLLVVSSMLGQPVDNERLQANPTTKFRWFHSKTRNQVTTLLNAGYRLTDIEVVQASPLRLSGSMVRNSGDHQKAWRWYVGLTSQQVLDTAAKYTMRAIDIEVYRVNGKKRMAVAFVKNTGDQAALWSYFTDRTLGYLLDKAEETGSRILDLDTYRVNGQRYYSGVLIRNTGKNYKGWWVYNNRTGAELLALASQHNANIVDLERKGDNNYIAVLEKSSHPNFKDQFVLWRGESLGNITEIANHFGGRIVDLETYTRNGQRRFDLVLLDNTNALTTRIGNLLRSNIGGTVSPYDDDITKRGTTVGFRLKEIGGPVKASLQSNRKIYPASTNKIIEYWYVYRALLQNAANPASVLQNGTWRRCKISDGVNCPNSSNVSVGCDSLVTLRNLLRTMMFNSDNMATNALQDYAGNGNPILGRSMMINWARNLIGISNNTLLRHKFGCGAATNQFPNTLTVKDLNLIYEKIFSDNNVLNPNLEDVFLQNMLTKGGSPLWNRVAAVINSEGAKLGLTNDEITNFRTATRFAYKGGNIGTTYVSVGGWIELPYYCGLTQKQFTFSSFWDHATTSDRRNTGSNLSNLVVVSELLRDEIRNAMASCRNFGLTLNYGTGNPVPGVTLVLEKQDPSGRFSPVSPASANMAPAVNPQQSSRTGSFGWSIFQKGKYRVIASAPGYQQAISDTFRIRNNGKQPRNKHIYLSPICPSSFYVETCPDQYLAPHYPGRQVARIKAKARGGQKPYTYHWSTGAEGTEMFASPFEDSLPLLPPNFHETAQYHVTAIDANGCQVSAVHTVHVVDIRCQLRSGEEAIAMCNQTGRTSQTTCVPLSDVAAKLSSGDWVLGDCSAGIDFSGGSCGNPQGLPRPAALRSGKVLQMQTPPMKVFPNPFTDRVSLSFVLPHDMNISLKVYTMTGKLIHTVKKKGLTDGGQRVDLHALNLPSGVYNIVLTGEKGFRQQVKAVKM
ncbi:MAG: serine hydrolase [Bacteroidia bacterium]